MRLIADNLQITNPKFQKAVSDLDPFPIRACIKRCVEAGAEAIDVNAGPLTREPEKRMRFLVETVQSVTSLPLYLDTANPAALREGISVAKNPVVINGVSLEPEKLKAILPLARRHDVPVIGYLLYANGQVPKTTEERLAVAVELFSELERAGISPETVIVDPVVPPLMWEDGTSQAKAVLETIRALPELLGFPVRTIAGLSNLTTGPGPAGKKRRAEGVYLAMLAASGLTHALLNVFHEETVRVAQTCDLLTSGKIFSWEAIP